MYQVKAYQTKLFAIFFNFQNKTILVLYAETTINFISFFQSYPRNRLAKIDFKVQIIKLPFK